MHTTHCNNADTYDNNTATGCETNGESDSISGNNDKTNNHGDRIDNIELKKNGVATSMSVRLQEQGATTTQTQVVALLNHSTANNGVEED